jgi:uncharacterized protein (PEP-CTERM system associated)
LSPYIRRDTDTGWTYEVRNQNFWNTYDTEGLSDSVTHRISAFFDSPPTRLRYGGDYSFFYSRDDSQSIAYYEQVVRFRPSLAVTPRLTVSARIGYETVEYVTDSSGPIYGAGVDWTPTPRTRLEAFLEHRYFGPSYGLDFSHRTRFSIWRLRATRDTYTTLDQPLTLRPGTTAEALDAAFETRFTDPAQREQAVREFMQRAGLPPALTQPYTFYTNQIYVSEQWSGSVILLGRRNTLEFELFWQDNEPTTVSGDALLGVFATFERFRQWGAAAIYTRGLSPRTTFTFSARRTYAETTSVAIGSSESVEDALRASVTRQLSSKSSVSIGLRYTDFDSDDIPYRELAAIGAFAHNF